MKLNAEVRNTVVAIVWCLLVTVTLVLIAPLNPNIKPRPQTVYRTGELPIGTVVMLYFLEDDGRITGTSAIRTDYAGVLPFSIINRPVAATPIVGYFAWSELKPIALEALQ